MQRHNFDCPNEKCKCRDDISVVVSAWASVCDNGIVRAVNSHEHLIRACRLLEQAYTKGAESEHVEWDDLNIAHDAADLALGIADDHPRLRPDPEKMNGDRAEWAAAALRQFQRATGCDYEDSLGDLLCDLMHWSDRNNFDFEAALCRARGHYEAETAGGQP